MPLEPLVVVPVPCYLCKKVYELTAYKSQWDAYSAGTYAQDAFPDWTPAERELLISHTCGTCFDMLFPPDEDDT